MTAVALGVAASLAWGGAPTLAQERVRISGTVVAEDSGAPLRGVALRLSSASGAAWTAMSATARLRAGRGRVGALGRKAFRGTSRFPS